MSGLPLGPYGVLPAPPTDYKAKVKGVGKQILAYLRHTPSTCEELETALGKTSKAVSPRLSELRLKTGQIVDSGIERTNRSGLNAIVWRLTTSYERASYSRTDHTGYSIRCDRERLCVSLSVLAKACDLDPQYLGKIESGDAKATVAEAYAIGMELGSYESG